MLTGYFRHWYTINGVIGLATITGVVIGWGRLDVLQRILLLQFAVMNLHHYEEFGFPGGFPALANGRQLHSHDPDRMPLNQATCAFGNNWFNYLVYLPAVFLNRPWLSLAIVTMGILEVLMHGIYYTRLTRHWYNPGLITSLIGFGPLSVGYLVWAYGRGAAAITALDWVGGIAYAVISYGVIFRLVMTRVMATPKTRFPFTPTEMERIKRATPNLTDRDLYPAGASYPPALVPG